MFDAWFSFLKQPYKFRYKKKRGKSWELFFFLGFVFFCFFVVSEDGKTKHNLWMDWNFKLSSGYLSEFEQESVPDLSPIDGSISFGGSSPKGDFSFDLKLGRNIGSSSSAFGNTEQVISLSKWKERSMAKPDVSRASGSSSSSKRTRGNGVGNNQMPICLVDGCDSDFSNCREYHKRHKVCEVHSKTPVVTINGHKQRFCQQCSR